jgi:hypothetical protein
MFDDINVELHRTVRELTARAEAKVREGQLGLAWVGLLGHEAQEGSEVSEQGQHH